MADYQIKWQQEIDGTNQIFNINMSDTVYETLDTSTKLNQQWNTNNCYAGALYNSKGTYTKYSTMKPNGVRDYSKLKVDISEIRNTQNIRLCGFWIATTESPTRRNFSLRWSNLNQEQEAYYRDSSTSYQYYDPLTRTNRTTNPTLCPTNRISSYRQFEINKLILNPIFIFANITLSGYNYYNDGGIYYKDITATGYSKSWSEIKNQDKTPQGADYDDDLFTNGYKINSRDSDSISITCCIGCLITPFYGESSHTYDEITDTYVQSVVGRIFANRQIFSNLTSDTGHYPNNNRRCYPTIVYENFNSDLNSITYTTPAGISFYSADTYIPTSNMSQVSQLFDSANILYTTNSNFDALQTSITPFCMYNNQTGITTDENNPYVVFPTFYTKGTVPNNEEFVYGTQTSSVQRYLLQLDDTFCNIASGFASGTNNYIISMYTCYSIESLWTTIASFGFYVSADLETAKKAKTGKFCGQNNRLYLGEMLSNGTTTGNMIQGIDIQDSVQADMSDISETPYVPIVPEDETDPEREEIKPPTREGDNISLQLNNRFGAFTGFLTMYNLTESELASFGSALLGSPLNYRGNFQKDLSQQLSGTYDVSSILNYIVSAKIYPFSVATLPNTTTQGTSNVFIGTGEFGVPIGTQCRILTSSISVLYAGSLDVRPLTPYNDFRDYYNTTIVCYMPYCGSVELNPMDIMNTVLHCYYLIDFLTGECTAILYSEGVNSLNYPVAVANGNIGIDIPLSATNSGQLSAVKKMENAQLAHTVVSFANIGLNTIGDIGNLGGEVGVAMMQDKVSASSIMSAFRPLANDVLQFVDSAFAHSANPYGGNKSARSAVASPLMPTGSGATNFMLNDSVYLQIRRGTYSRPNNYASTMGYPTTFSKRLSEVRGLTYCTNVNVTGINCTQEEKALIKEALEGGTIF